MAIIFPMERKQEMTTLEQCLEESAKRLSRGTDSMDLPLYPIQWGIIQDGVKEWLQQKQQSYEKIPNCVYFIQQAKLRVLNELLEELQ